MVKRPPGGGGSSMGSGLAGVVGGEPPVYLGVRPWEAIARAHSGRTETLSDQVAGRVATIATSLGLEAKDLDTAAVERAKALLAARREGRQGPSTTTKMDTTE